MNRRPTLPVGTLVVPIVVVIALFAFAPVSSLAQSPAPRRPAATPAPRPPSAYQKARALPTDPAARRAAVADYLRRGQGIRYFLPGSPNARSAEANPDPAVVQEARQAFDVVEAICELRDTAIYDALLDDDPQVRREALWVLFHRDLGLLNGDARTAAVEILHRAIPNLAAHGRDENPRIRDSAIELLRHAGSDGWHVLYTWLADPPSTALRLRALQNVADDTRTVIPDADAQLRDGALPFVFDQLRLPMSRENYFSVTAARRLAYRLRNTPAVQAQVQAVGRFGPAAQATVTQRLASGWDPEVELARVTASAGPSTTRQPQPSASSTPQPNTPRPGSRPDLARDLRLNTHADFVRNLDSPDPAVRAAVLSRMRNAQVLDDAMLDRVLALADDPATPPDALATAALALTMRGPRYFEKLTEDAVRADPAKSQPARRILNFAARAGVPAGFRPNPPPNDRGLAASYREANAYSALNTLQQDDRSIAAGEEVRRKLESNDPDFIRALAKAYGGGSVPSHRLGPVTLGAAKAAARSTDPNAYHRYRVQDEYRFLPPKDLHWTPPAPAATNPLATLAHITLETLTWALIPLTALLATTYLLTRPRLKSP